MGSGVIDAYAGWIGTVSCKVNSLDSKQQADGSEGQIEGKLDQMTKQDDMVPAFTRLAAVAGTSTCHLMLSRDPIFVDGVWGPYHDVLIPGFCMAEGGQSATGELLRHVVESHPAYAEAALLAEENEESIYDFLNGYLLQLASKKNAPFISFLGRYLFFYGDLWGNRSPLGDNAMRGAVVGLDSDNSVDALALLYYVAMEFIALQTRQIIETMNKAGHTISSIFVSGSQCKNPLLMNLIATTCSMPVVIPQYAGAAVVHGAALLGADLIRARASATPRGWYRSWSRREAGNYD